MALALIVSTVLTACGEQGGQVRLQLPAPSTSAEAFQNVRLLEQSIETVIPDIGHWATWRGQTYEGCGEDKPDVVAAMYVRVGETRVDPAKLLTAITAWGRAHGLYLATPHINDGAQIDAVDDRPDGFSVGLLIYKDHVGVADPASHRVELSVTAPCRPGGAVPSDPTSNY